MVTLKLNDIILKDKSLNDLTCNNNACDVIHIDNISMYVMIVRKGSGYDNVVFLSFEES